MIRESLALAVALHTSAAFARPSATLVYEPSLGTEGCPDEAGLRTRVTTRLGFDPFAASAPVHIRASLTHEPGRFQGTVRALDDQGNVQGERKLAGASCSELVEAMAVTISILLDPKSFGSANPVGPATPPAPRTLDSSPEPMPGQAQGGQPSGGASSNHVAPVAWLPPREPRFVRLGAELVGSLGAAPGAALGAAALVGARAGDWSLDLEGRIDAPAETMRADGTGVRSSLLLALVVPCAHRGWFVACPLLALGALSGQGVNVGAPARETTFYAALAARIGVEAPLGRQLALRVHGDLGAPITRTTLSDRGQEVWTTPVLFASAALGLVARFP